MSCNYLLIDRDAKEHLDMGRHFNPCDMLLHEMAAIANFMADPKRFGHRIEMTNEHFWHGEKEIDYLPDKQPSPDSLGAEGGETMTITSTDQNGDKVVETGVKINPPNRAEGVR